MVYFFLISSVFLTSFYVGPYSIRVYSGLLLFLALLFSSNRNSIKGVEYLWIYLLFIFFVLVSQLITGDFETQNFPKRFLAYDFISILTFWGIMKEVEREEQFRKIIVLFTMFNLFNALISIGQVLNIQWSWKIANYISVSNYSEDMVESYMRKNVTDSMFASSFISGLLGNTVINGLVTASLTLLSICVFSYKSKIIKYVGLISFALGLTASFVVQQRAAFYMLILSCFIVVSFKIKKIWFACVGGVLILFLFNSDVENFEFLGRLTDHHNEIRENLNSFSLDYIWQNLLFGGMEEYVHLAQFHPHNYLFSGFILGGFCGGIAALIFYAVLFAHIIKIFSKEYYRRLDTIVLSCILLTNILVSFSHNTSMVVGDNIIWIFLALLIKIQEFDDKTSVKNIVPSTRRITA